jgi:hypothetical protein
VIEINRDWLRIRKAAGLPADLTLHGLRHSVGTVAVIAGMSAPEVQKLLRHRNIGATAKYLHLADRARLQGQGEGQGGGDSSASLRSTVSIGAPEAAFPRRVLVGGNGWKLDPQWLPSSRLPIHNAAA